MISKQCYGYVKAPWQDTWKQNVPSSRSGLNRHFNILYSVLSLSVIEDVEAGTTKVRLKNLSQQHLYFFKFDVEVFHFNPPKKEEKFVIFLLFFVRNFIRTRTDGGGDISSTHFVLFRTTCFHCAQSFCCKWGGTSTKKKKKPSINHFLGNGSLIQQDGLSDDLQLLVINANSDLWPAVLHQNSSSTASSPRSKRPSAYWSPVMLAPQPCSSLYCFLHFFFLLFTSFHL